MFSIMILHCKIMLGRGQSEMNFDTNHVQGARSLEVLTCSPARYNCAMVAPILNKPRL